MSNESATVTKLETLKMIAGRDAKQQSLEELKGYSSTVVRQVFSEVKPLVVTGTEEGKALGSESAVLHGLRSIMAVPLKVQEKVLGVVYLDSHLAKGLFTDEDLDLLSAISNHIAIAFETAKMANVEANRRALEKDLALAAAVQTLFLPEQPVFRTEKISIAGYYHPAALAGGDFWWYRHHDSKNLLHVLVGDVTGHGAASAMITAATAGILQTVTKDQNESSLDSIVSRLNSEFIQIARNQYSMTMSAIEIDAGEKKLRWWNAAAPEIFILTREKEIKTLALIGTPLGTEIFKLGYQEMEFRSGDRLFVFTDGVSELVMPNGSFIRTKQLIRIFEQTHGLSAQNAVQAIVKGLDDARKNTPLKDDITFLLVDMV